MSDTVASAARGRIHILDGFRALAVLLVMGFHYLSRWTFPKYKVDLYPFHQTFAKFPLFEYGYLGVELFFIISGFVITMTLEKCATPAEFAVRRFARLWPPLLVCATITFLFLTFVVPGGYFSAKPDYFLPSLTFTPPMAWHWLDPKIAHIDGAYWSLTVEVVFYFWATLLYFGLGKQHFYRNFVIFGIIGVLVFAVANQTGQHNIKAITKLIFLPKYIFFFVAGAYFYKLWSSGKTNWIDVYSLIGLLFAVIGVYIMGKKSPGDSIAVVGLVISLFFGLFFLFIYAPKYLKVFESRLIQIIGLSSYSVYLLHQRIGVGLISQLNQNLPLAVQILAVLAIAIGVLGVAYFSFIYVEKTGKKLVLRTLGKRFLVAKPATSG